MHEGLKIYTLYDHPLDYPDDYVIRGYTVLSGQVVPDENIFFKSARLSLCRERMALKGLLDIGRQVEDDPKILESYI